MLILKQFGVGLAAAILIDATIVRASAPAGVDEAARATGTGTCRRGSSGSRTSSTARTSSRSRRRPFPHPPPESRRDERKSPGFRIRKGCRDAGRGGPADGGRSREGRARHSDAPRRRRQLPPATAGHVGRRPPGRGPRAGRALPPVRLGLPAPSAGTARDARRLRRALHRRDGHRGGRVLHARERAVRRRLHRTPGDPGRLPPDRGRPRDTVEVEKGRRRDPPVRAAGRS